MFNLNSKWIIKEDGKILGIERRRSIKEIDYLNDYGKKKEKEDFISIGWPNGLKCVLDNQHVLVRIKR